MFKKLHVIKLVDTDQTTVLMVIAGLFEAGIKNKNIYTKSLNGRIDYEYMFIKATKKQWGKFYEQCEYCFDEVEAK